jgi:leucyl aminopeptidase
MKFQLKSSSKTNIANLATDCLIITTSCISKLKFHENTTTYVNKILKQEELVLDANINKLLLLFNVPGIAANRLLLISTGKKNTLSDFQFIEMIKNITNHLIKYNISNATLCIESCNVKNRSLDWQIYQTITNLQNCLYVFDYYKSKKNHKKHKISDIDLFVDHKSMSIAMVALNQALAVSHACKLVKDLANTPPNVCTTEFMAKSAVDLSKKSSKIKLTILERKDLENLNMGAFLAVAKGSLQPPKLICLEYKGHIAKSNSKNTRNNQPIVFIGKGITFDTGGNSLKPANSMVGMKYDMCGAATVLGLINFAVEMKLNLNIVGIIATAENMPGRHACRPDDVVTTMSGITVEILNTDAEGRLILCDALTYCKKFNPKAVIDIATLTGACSAALGQHHSGLFGNTQELANNLTAAGITSCDKAWQLPMTEEYSKQIDSDIADIANIGGPQAGSITAACFLAKFAENYKWAHLDIAGTAYYAEGKVTRQASGRPIPMLAQYLVNQNKNPKN